MILFAKQYITHWKSILIIFPTLILSAMASYGFTTHTYHASNEHSVNQIALSPNDKEIYVLDDRNGILIIVDVKTEKTLKTIPLTNNPLNEYFRNIVFTPDGKKAYLGSPDRNIYIIDTNQREIVGKIGNKPTCQECTLSNTGLAITPDGNTLYATDTFRANKNSDYQAPRLHIINTQTDRVYQYIEKQNLSGWGWNETHFIFNKNADRLYFTDYNKGTVAILDTATNRLEDDAIAYFDSVSLITISPSNDKLYVMSYYGTLYVTDLMTRKQIDKIVAGRETFALALAANGSKLYVTDSISDVVSVFDTTQKIKLVKKIPVGKTPVTLYVSSDGSKLYVGNSGSSDISVIDIASDKIIRTIKINY